MENENYLSFEDTILLKKGFNLSAKIKDLDCAIFDFDGTLYSGLILFDMAKNSFSNNPDKLSALSQIGDKYKSGFFEESYTDFLNLLSGESKNKLLEFAKFSLNKSYPYGKLTVKRFQEQYGINCKLVSLTADFVAELIMEEYGFSKVSSVDYPTKFIDGVECFTGLTSADITDPSALKEKLFYKLISNTDNCKFIYFCDSLDDLFIIKKAEIKVAINPSKKLLELVEFDLIINCKKDPWKYLIKMI